MFQASDPATRLESMLRAADHDLPYGHHHPTTRLTDPAAEAWSTLVNWVTLPPGFDDAFASQCFPGPNLNLGILMVEQIAVRAAGDPIAC